MSENRGRKPRVTDEEILEIFRTAEDPVLSAGEVADQLPIQRRGVLDRLNSLAENEQIHSKKVGGRSVVWWYPD